MSFAATKFATVQSLLCARLEDLWQHGAPGGHFRSIVRRGAFGDNILGLGVVELARGPLSDLGAEQLLYEHSLYPVYEMLIPSGQRAFWRSAIMNASLMGASLVTALKQSGFIQSGRLRMCHLCATRDFLASRRSMWRTFHQLPFAQTCAIDGAPLKDRCFSCGTPYLRSQWGRLPHHGCASCGIPQLCSERRPYALPGPRALEEWIFGVLERASDSRAALRNDHLGAAACASDVIDVPPRLLQHWGAASIEELCDRLYCVRGSVSSRTLRTVFGAVPAALRMATLSYFDSRSRVSEIALAKVCNSEHVQMLTGRRRCPSYIKPAPHLRVVGSTTLPSLRES